MSLPRAFDEPLVGYVLKEQPREVLLLGQWSTAASQIDTGTNTHIIPLDAIPECLPSQTPSSSAPTPGEVVALMALSAESPSLTGLSVGALLGQAVRRFPSRLIVSVDSAEWADSTFFAFGFRKLQLNGQGPIRLFEYRLSDYKRPPDWLNARFWANPERFNEDETLDFESEDNDEYE